MASLAGYCVDGKELATKAPTFLTVQITNANALSYACQPPRRPCHDYALHFTLSYVDVRKGIAGLVMLVHGHAAAGAVHRPPVLFAFWAAPEPTPWHCSKIRKSLS